MDSQKRQEIVKEVETGKLVLNHAKIRAEEHLDGKYLVSTWDDKLSARMWYWVTSSWRSSSGSLRTSNTWWIFAPSIIMDPGK